MTVAIFVGSHPFIARVTKCSNEGHSASSPVAGSGRQQCNAQQDGVLPKTDGCVQQLVVLAIQFFRKRWWNQPAGRGCLCHSEYKSLASFLIPYPPVIISSGGMNGGGAFQFAFTNTPGRAFTVLATTNVTLSISNWTVLGAPIGSPPGYFQFTDAQPTAFQQRSYRVRAL